MCVLHYVGTNAKLMVLNWIKKSLKLTLFLIYNCILFHSFGAPYTNDHGPYVVLLIVSLSKSIMPLESSNLML